MKISRAKVLVAVTAFAKAEAIPEAYLDLNAGRLNEISFSRMYLESSVMDSIVVTMSRSAFPGDVIVRVDGKQSDGQIVPVARECSSLLAVCKFLADVICGWSK